MTSFIRRVDAARHSWFRRWRWPIALVVAALLSHLIYPVVYFSFPIHGQVVDGKTGKPIEGAVVYATWRVKPFWSEGWSPYRLAIEEAVTDAEGSFRIAGWGPRFWFREGRLIDQPEILFLARGYKPRPEFGGLRGDYGGQGAVQDESPSVRRLRPLRDDEWLAYGSDLSSIATWLPMSGCEWPQTPNTARLLQQVEKDLEARQLPSSILPMCLEEWERRQRAVEARADLPRGQ